MGGLDCNLVFRNCNVEKNCNLEGFGNDKHVHGTRGKVFSTENFYVQPHNGPFVGLYPVIIGPGTNAKS